MLANKKNIQLYRGDDLKLLFPHEWDLADITEVRFYIRDEPDGTLYLRIRLSTEAAQVSVKDDYLTITVLDTDTSPLVEDRYRYDVEVTVATLKYTLQYGEVNVIGDISTDIVGDTTPSLQFYLESDEHDAVSGANSPSGTNVFATMDDLASEIEIVNDETPQLGGDLDANEKDIHDMKQVDFFETHDNLTSGTSKTINWNNGNQQKLQMTGDACDLSYTDPSGPCALRLILIGDGTLRTNVDADHDGDAEWLDNGDPSGYGDTDDEIIGILNYVFDPDLIPKYIVSGIART